MENKVKRRHFLQLVSATTFAAAGAPLLSLATNQEKNNRESILFLTKPYIQNPNHNAISIFWVTNKPAYSWLEITDPNGTTTKVFSANDGLIELQNKIHKVRLKDLKPETKYSYKVYSKEVLKVTPVVVKAEFGQTITDGPYEFTTAAAKPEEFSMLVLNDIHDRPESIAQLLKLNGDKHFDMVFLNGDMFNHVKDEEQVINHLIKPCTEVFSTGKPFLYLRGNHETRGILARNLNDYFENIDNSNYFTFTRGPVHFICLDSGEDKEDAHIEYAGLVDFDLYREQQLLWLKEQLKSAAFKKAKFKVVMMHIPHYHSGDWHGTMHCRKLFGPLFNKYKIDMLISGHTHTYGIHNPQDGHNFPIIIGGGPKDTLRTLTRLEATNKSLNITMTRDDGKIVGTYAIKR
jgi:predicted phosphodiesterase